MAAYFGVKSNMMSIGITVYMISLAVFIPVSGWVADKYGTCKVFVYAVLGFINTSTNPHSIVRYQLSFLLIVLVELIALTGYGKIKSEPEKIIANNIV